MTSIKDLKSKLKTRYKYDRKTAQNRTVFADDINDNCISHSAYRSMCAQISHKCKMESTLAVSQHGSWLTCLRTFQIPNINMAVCSEPQTFAFLVLLAFNQDDQVLLFWMLIMLAFSETYSLGMHCNFFSTSAELWHHKLLFLPWYIYAHKILDFRKSQQDLQAKHTIFRC